MWIHSGILCKNHLKENRCNTSPAVVSCRAELVLPTRFFCLTCHKSIKADGYHLVSYLIIPTWDL